MNLALVAPLFAGNFIGWVIVVLAVIIGGGLPVWALTLAIRNFLPSEWQPKATAVMYIVIAVILAMLVFHWAGMI